MSNRQRWSDGFASLVRSNRPLSEGETPPHGVASAKSPVPHVGEAGQPCRTTVRSSDLSSIRALEKQHLARLGGRRRLVPHLGEDADCLFDLLRVGRR